MKEVVARRVRQGRKGAKGRWQEREIWKNKESRNYKGERMSGKNKINNVLM